MDTKVEPESESELLKRKSKSPSLAGDQDAKRLKVEMDESEKSEDIAKQYKKFIASPKFNLNSEELFCVCRKPDLDGELMISCDGCEEWFHTKCMKIDSNYTQLLDKFYCKFCQWKGDGVTRWNRKCRMPSCLKPIRKTEKSKYCSDLCGEQFLRMKLVGSQALPKGHLSFVVNYSKNYTDLKDMGSKFPELPEVLSLDFSKLPPNIQQSLVENDERQKDITAQYDQIQEKAKYLARVKEMITIINEKVQALTGPAQPEEGSTKSKKKKSRSKKVDICCFQNDLNKDLFKDIGGDMLRDADVTEIFKDEIEEAVSRFSEESDAANGKMCLQDRRKCLRHNGWFNLLSDRVWKRSLELQNSLSHLRNEKSTTLRNYSISVYEKEL